MDDESSAEARVLALDEFFTIERAESCGIPRHQFTRLSNVLEKFYECRYPTVGRLVDRLSQEGFARVSYCGPLTVANVRVMLASVGLYLRATQSSNKAA